MTTARPASSWLSIGARITGALIALSPFLPPIFERANLPRLAALFDEPFQGMCHRMPSRSLAFLGVMMPLCTRCLGLVSGFGVGLVVARPAMSLRALRITVSLACAFLFVELTTQDLGWHPVFHPTRLLSGLLVAYPIGAAISAYLRKLPAQSMTSESPQPSSS